MKFRAVGIKIPSNCEVDSKFSRKKKKTVLEILVMYVIVLHAHPSLFQVSLGMVVRLCKSHTVPGLSLDGLVVQFCCPSGHNT